MGGGFNLIDIFLVALAAFLVFRLGGVLGKRTGNERRRTDIFSKPDSQSESGNDNVIALPERAEAESEAESDELDGIAKIRQRDRNFSTATFLDGAQSAFEMIVNAFAAGDGKTLNMLLSTDVYENFAGAIRSRELAHNTLETTLVGIKSADIIEAELKGRDAVVTVKFISEQINATLDENGNVIDGDSNAVNEVTDIWTFSRDTSSSDPNWKLVSTRSSN